MESPKETDQVFHPSSIPIDRATKQREERKQSCRFCFYASIVILALFGGIVIIGGGYLANKLIKDFLFPTKAFALHHKHAERFNTSQVHPLIDASTTFDIHATVWQDVTDLLARGQQLPQRDSPWKLVEFELTHRSAGGYAKNESRTEAVLWSGVVAQGARLDSKIHNTIPLRVPIAPLYTPNLGRSSLRATFSIAIPDHKARVLGSFRNFSSVFTSDSPLLPRRPDFAEQDASHDLNSALAEVGVSTSLLELVPSPWYRTTPDGERAEPTIASMHDLTVGPFYDAHRHNLHFLDAFRDHSNQTAPDQLPEFRDLDGIILLPHFRTRSRLGMARVADAFSNKTFQRQHRSSQIFVKDACKNSVDWPCNRDYRNHAFQTKFTFAKTPELGSSADSTASQDPKEEIHVFYAPTLTTVSTPGSPMYQRRIPHHMPVAGQLSEPITLRSNASTNCEIPPALSDDTKEYFHFDWEFYFSSHTLQRSLMAESSFSVLQRAKAAPLAPGEEGEKELIANSVAEAGMTSAYDRFLTGDRVHVKDHPTPVILIQTAGAIWHVLVDELLIFFFWFTRRTSAGFWIEAQWLWVAFQLSNFVTDLIRPFISTEADPYPSFFSFLFQLVLLFHIPLVATTLLHLERPAGYDRSPWWKRNPIAFRRRRLTGRERKSIASARTIDKKPFLILFASYFLLHLVARRRFILLRPGDTCQVDDSVRKRLVEKIFNRSVFAFQGSLLQLHFLAQAWFNHRAGTFTESFRISAIGAAVVACLSTLSYGLQTLSHWPNIDHTPPFSLLDVINLGPRVWLAFQALTLKGVPQVEAVDDDDE